MFFDRFTKIEIKKTEKTVAAVTLDVFTSLYLITVSLNLNLRDRISFLHLRLLQCLVLSIEMVLRAIQQTKQSPELYFSIV